MQLHTELLLAEVLEAKVSRSLSRQTSNNVMHFARLIKHTDDSIGPVGNVGNNCASCCRSHVDSIQL